MHALHLYPNFQECDNTLASPLVITMCIVELQVEINCQGWGPRCKICRKSNYFESIHRVLIQSFLINVIKHHTSNQIIIFRYVRHYHDEELEGETHIDGRIEKK